MRKSWLSFIWVFVCCLSMDGSYAQNTQVVVVGGAPMDPLKNMVDNLLHSNDHTALLATIRAANMGGTLNGAGPFTLFAPNNEAFNKLPPDTTDDWLKPENQAQAIKVLSYHVVAGKVGVKTLLKMIKKAKGKATLKTMEGDNMYATQEDGHILLWDELGNKSTITISDAWQKNGVIHVIDTVLHPK
jgi:uncharacterized surface protein with fasciclin (FAS1) repeats